MTRARRRLEPVAIALAYGVFGLLAGVVTTFLHRGRVEIAGAPIWLGMIGGVVAIAALAVGLRLYLGQRLPTVAFAVGVGAAIALLTGGGAGRSIVIPGDGLDAAGTIWMCLAAAAVVLPAIWPRLPQRAVVPSAAAGAPAVPEAGGVPWNDPSVREGAPE